MPDARTGLPADNDPVDFLEVGPLWCVHAHACTHLHTCMRTRMWHEHTMVQQACMHGAADGRTRSHACMHLCMAIHACLPACWAVQIGSAALPVGANVRAKVLGALALVDQNETDWKVRRPGA